MTRKRKTLVFGLVAAVVALGAVGAQANWEAEGEAELELYLTGTQITHNAKSFHVITVANEEIKCEELFFTGQMKGGEEKATLTPTFGQCRTEAGLYATVTKNGCDFTLFKGNMRNPLNEDHIFGGTFDVFCPGAVKKMEIHIYQSAEKQSKNESKCTVTIPAQGGLDEVTYTNTPEEPADVDATIQITKMQTEVDGVEKDCGKKDQNAGYTGAITIRAFSNAEHTDQIGVLTAP